MSMKARICGKASGEESPGMKTYSKICLARSYRLMLKNWNDIHDIHLFQKIIILMLIFVIRNNTEKNFQTG